MARPQASIILPTYNRAAFLPRAIASVQAQILEDWELIITDDGSTDETRDVLAPMVAADPRIRVIANHGIHGPAAARNAGIAAARGPAIAFLDSDDFWQPTKLSRFLAVLNRSDDIVLVGSDYLMVDHAGAQSATMKSFLFDTMLKWWESYPAAAAAIPCARLRADPAAIASRDLIVPMTIGGFLWIHTSSAMVRRDAVARVGMFDARLSRTEDIDLWLKLNRLGRFAYVDEVLAHYDITGRDGAMGERYRSHETRRRHTAFTEVRHHLRLLQRIRRSEKLTPAEQVLLAERIAEHRRRCISAALHERIPAGLALALPLAGQHLGAKTGRLAKHVASYLKRAFSQV